MVGDRGAHGQCVRRLRVELSDGLHAFAPDALGLRVRIAIAAQHGQPGALDRGTERDDLCLKIGY
jgi:hypothetical protein